MSNNHEFEYSINADTEKSSKNHSCRIKLIVNYLSLSLNYNMILLYSLFFPNLLCIIVLIQKYVFMQFKITEHSFGKFTQG